MMLITLWNVSTKVNNSVLRLLLGVVYRLSRFDYESSVSTLVESEGVLHFFWLDIEYEPSCMHRFLWPWVAWNLSLSMLVFQSQALDLLPRNRHLPHSPMSVIEEYYLHCDGACVDLAEHTYHGVGPMPNKDEEPSW
jgi:hypothetical protein